MASPSARGKFQSARELKISYQEVFEKLQKIGGEPFICQMIKLFLQNAPQKLKDLESALRLRDFRALEYAAHELKSCASNVGAGELYEAARNIEGKCLDKSEKNLSECIPLSRHLKVIFKRDCRYLQSVLEKRSENKA